MRPLLKVLLFPSNQGDSQRALLFKIDRFISQIQVLPLLGTQYLPHGIVSDTQREASKWQPSSLAGVFNAWLYK